jgi:hypothetical protein
VHKSHTATLIAEIAPSLALAAGRIIGRNLLLSLSIKED